jgi:hypothetical protein
MNPPLRRISLCLSLLFLALIHAAAFAADPSLLKFRLAGTFEAGPPPSDVNAIVGDDIIAADVNGDGKMDLLVPNFSVPYVSVLLGNGDGTFQPLTSYWTGSKTYPIYATVGDLNQGGKLDLAVATELNVAILPGNGDGTFGDPSQSGSGLGLPQEPISVATGDFNLDGKLDLLVDTEEPRVFTSAGNFSGSYLLVGQGNGKFSNKGVLADGVSSIADMNGDGLADLLVVLAPDPSNPQTPRLALRFAQPDGTFAPAIRSNSVSALGWLIPGDFNGDSRNRRSFRLVWTEFSSAPEHGRSGALPARHERACRTHFHRNRSEDPRAWSTTIAFGRF